MPIARPVAGPPLAVTAGWPIGLTAVPLSVSVAIKRAVALHDASFKRSRVVRTALTMPGMISLAWRLSCTMVALGSGRPGRHQKGECQVVGTNMITIFPGSVTIGGVRLGDGSSSHLTADDAKTLRWRATQFVTRQQVTAADHLRESELAHDFQASTPSTSAAAPALRRVLQRAGRRSRGSDSVSAEEHVADRSSPSRPRPTGVDDPHQRPCRPRPAASWAGRLDVQRQQMALHDSAVEAARHGPSTYPCRLAWPTPCIAGPRRIRGRLQRPAIENHGVVGWA